MKKYLVEYSSNNSGGNWWLNDKDWKNLEKAGWLVVWHSKSFDYKNGNYQYDKNGLPKLKNKPDEFFCGELDKKGNYRWLRSLARIAFKRFDSITDALKEFEKITGEQVDYNGCNCCGAPHCFSWGENNSSDAGYCSGKMCLEYF